MLETAKLTFSRVGVHTMEGHVGNMYMPRIVLRIQGRKSAKIGYLMPDRFDRKDYIGLALLPDFIVVITKNEYIVVDEKAEERKAISRDEAGEIVGVQEEGFLAAKRISYSSATSIVSLSESGRLLPRKSRNWTAKSKYAGR